MAQEKDVARLVLELSADVSKLDRGMRQGQAIAERRSSAIEKSFDQLNKRTSRSISDMNRTIAGGFTSLSNVARLAAGAFTVYALKLATDAGEIESAFDVAFKGASGSVRQFSEQLADTAGRDAVVLRESMTRLQLVLTGTGVAAETAAGLVKALTTSGVDAGSLFNTSDAEALQKIVSGLTGETEPLKAFGVVINEAAVKTELLRLGFKGNATAASESAKSIARANLIIKGLSVAQGDAARTANSAANTTKRMRAEFDIAARAVGQELLPAMTKLFGATTDVLRAFNDLPGGVQVAGLAFLGLIAAGGPIAGLLANFGKVIKVAREARAAIIAAGAAGSAAGAAGGAGGAAALLARAVPLAGAAAGVLSLSGDTQQRAPANLQERVNTQLREETRLRGLIVSLTSQGKTEEAARQRAYLSRIETSRQMSQGILAGAAIARDVASDLKDVNTEVEAGFKLTDEQKRAAGGDRGGSKARSGPSAEELAATQEQIRLEGVLALARASGDRAAEQAAQRQLDINSLTAQMTAAQIADARTMATQRVDAIIQSERWGEEVEKAGEQLQRALEKDAELNERLTAEMDRQLQVQIDLARIQGDDRIAMMLERELRLRQAIVALGPTATPDEVARVRGDENALNNAEDVAMYRERGQDMATAFVDVVRSDDIGKAIGDRFREAAFDKLQDVLGNLFSGLFNPAAAQGGGIGGTLAKAAASLFGGGRALGGPVKAGMTYRVNENTPRSEYFTPSQDGYVGNMPQAKAQRTPQNVTIRQGDLYLAGANGDAVIYGNVRRMMEQNRRQTLADVKAGAPAAQLEQQLLKS